MIEVHVECKPDELLVSKLGVPRKSITHHSGKSRVFKSLSKKKDQLAMVDEDPGSARQPYENSLRLIEVKEGIRSYIDPSNNKVFVLTGKLEDWIVWNCKKQKINLSIFNLPDTPDKLHSEINNKLQNFGRLIDELIVQKNPGIMKLKAWLK